MSPNHPTSSRRTFLTRAAAAAAAVPLASVPAAAGTPPLGSRDRVPEQPRAASVYLTLDADEAAFVEVLLRALCPADHLTPDGVTCGLAAVIDRELAGAYSASARAFAPIAWAHGSVCEPRDSAVDRQYFRAGVAAVNAVTRAHHGVRFDELPSATALDVFGDIETGSLTHDRFPVAQWVRSHLWPLLMSASLAAPIHEGYGNRVHWKVIGSV